MNITVNCNNSIRLEDTQIIYCDPLNIDGRPEDADVILIGHSHYDHFSPEDILRVACPGTIIVAPESCRAEILDKLNGAGFFNSPDRDEDFFQFVAPGEALEIDDITIETVPAYNIGKNFHKKENDWLGFIITMNGKRYYIVDDSDNTSEANAVACDYLFVPIGGTYTMDVNEAAALTNNIKPSTVIPTHYGSVVGKPEDGKAFAKLIDNEIKVEFKLFA